MQASLLDKLALCEWLTRDREGGVCSGSLLECGPPETAWGLLELKVVKGR